MSTHLIIPRDKLALGRKYNITINTQERIMAGRFCSNSPLVKVPVQFRSCSLPSSHLFPILGQAIPRGTRRPRLWQTYACRPGRADAAVSLRRQYQQIQNRELFWLESPSCSLGGVEAIRDPSYSGGVSVAWGGLHTVLYEYKVQGLGRRSAVLLRITGDIYHIIHPAI
jgi:hypothetical protein